MHTVQWETPTWNCVVWRGSACWSLESSYGRRQELRRPDLRGDFRSRQAWADIPEIALSSGATVIHVNIADVCLRSPNELMLIGAAAQVLPELLQATPSR